MRELRLNAFLWLNAGVQWNYLGIGFYLQHRGLENNCSQLLSSFTQCLEVNSLLVIRNRGQSLSRDFLLAAAGLLLGIPGRLLVT